MRNALALATVALCTAAFASVAAAQPRTTEPGVVYPVKTVLTAKKVMVERDRFSRNGQPRYPRGAVIRFVIVNRTKRALVFEVWGERTHAIRPGRQASMLINWNYRGRFVYRMLYRGRTVGARGYVTIF